MMPNKGGAVSDDSSSTGGGSDGAGLKKGPWTAAEDAILMEYVKKHGEGNWNAVQKNSGLSRCGKSCRLRWANHLRPNLKKGSFSPDEERLILELHAKLGNKWARMAAQLPGRTDNEIKNYWNTRVKRRQRAGLPLYPQDIQKQAAAFHLHHNHQLCPSPSPTQMPLSSSQQQKPNFGSPISQFDSMNFSSTTPLLRHHNNTPFLPMPVHDFKRFRSSNFGLSQPFSPHSSTLPPSSSLFNQSFSTPLLPTPTLQFNSGNYNPNSAQFLRTYFEPNVMVQTDSPFSMKVELPSDQLPQPAAATAAASGITDDYKMSPSLARSNSGLLDALFQEAETMGGGEDVKKEGLTPFNEVKGGFDGFIGDAPPSKLVFSESTTNAPLGSASQWDDSSPAHSSIGPGMKKEPTNEILSMDEDDFSSFFDFIPSSMLVADLYNEGGETSNGQSSVVTDEDIGRNMRQLPSSLPVTATTADNDWTAGAWNHVPGMC